jgi:hypothetical protein
MEIPGRSWKFQEDHGNSRKIMEIPGRSWKFQEDHGNSRKIMEILGRSWKFQEDHGNSRKIMEIPGRKFCLIILERFNIYYVLFYKLDIIIFFYSIA